MTKKNHAFTTVRNSLALVFLTALPVLGATGTIFYNSSTNLPAKVKARFADLRKKNVRYVPAPVFMSPQNAREASGLMLIAGPKADADALQNDLATMTGKLLWAGERTDLAAVWKLAGNSIFFALAAAMNDVFAIGKGNDVTPEQMLTLFETFKPGAALSFLAARHALRERLLADPGFGRVFTDHMVMIRYNDAKGWHDAKVMPRGPLSIDPATAVLHYAQEIFEGLKAYRQPDGGIALFRPEKNAARFSASARRLAMAPLEIGRAHV